MEDKTDSNLVKSHAKRDEPSLSLVKSPAKRDDLGLSMIKAISTPKASVQNNESAIPATECTEPYVSLVNCVVQLKRLREDGLRNKCSARCLSLQIL